MNNGYSFNYFVCGTSPRLNRIVAEVGVKGYLGAFSEHKTPDFKGLCDVGTMTTVRKNTQVGFCFNGYSPTGIAFSGGNEKIIKAGFIIPNMIHRLGCVLSPIQDRSGITVFEYAVIGVCCEVGKNVTVDSGAKVMPGSKIGDETYIGPNAVVGHNVKLGSRCIIRAGAVIDSGKVIEDGSIIERSQVSVSLPGETGGAKSKTIRPRRRKK